MKFRPDLHGLRGVAVLLVVIYHANIGPLRGGYVGVDVFLVISGFLITGILLKSIDESRFSAVEFYSRRARRLLPAATVMIATTLAAGYFILGPQDLQRLAAASIFACALAANFFFALRQNYFADQIPEQALLHTWSLGLEEQYYLLYPPLLLWIVARVRLALFVSLTALLWVLSLWLTAVHPIGAFFLLPARAWEFLLGGLVALLARRPASSRRVRTAVGMAGLIGILAAAVALTPVVPYPGLAATLPVAGAGAVIWANSQDATFSGRLLSARWLVAVGAVSYSLYLWHWPVLSLARYYAGRSLDIRETLCALSAVALLSYASLVWIERPFRAASFDLTAARKSLMPICALGAATLCASAFAIRNDGFPARLSAQARSFAAAALPDGRETSPCHHGPPQEGRLCTLAAGSPESPLILVWGDSHANAIVGALADLGIRHDATVIQASYSGCPPLIDADVAHVSIARYCREFNTGVLRAVHDRGIRRALLTAYWTAYLPARPQTLLARLLDPYRDSRYLGGGSAADNERNFAVALQRTVSALRSNGVEVWIMGQVPAQRILVPLALERAAARGEDYSSMGITLEAYRDSQAAVNRLFEQFGSIVHFIDPGSLLCASGRCLCVNAQQSLYVDSHHLSPTGARLIEPLLEPLFADGARRGAGR